VKVGPLTVSPMGLGTWAWGYQLLNLAVSKGINLFDTADSYGTGKLNGRSELLLGKFIREYPGKPSEFKTILQQLQSAPLHENAN
jgi:pyridoxine 4-dehydrogenase